jgi:hypothetical protein
MNYYEGNKPFSLESEEFYKSIIRVIYSPSEKVTWVIPYRRKGDVIYRRNLFTLFKKKVKEVVQEDIIRETGWGDYYYSTISEYAKKNNHLIIDGVLYTKPRVLIETNVKDGNRIVKFETEAEAMNYITSLKENCKKCGNNLL